MHFKLGQRERQTEKYRERKREVPVILVVIASSTTEVKETASKWFNNSLGLGFTATN